MITLSPRHSSPVVSGFRQTPTSISLNAEILRMEPRELGAQLQITGRNVVQVDLSAHVDLSSSNALHDLMNELLDNRQGYTVIVSFSDVQYVDWTGLGVLLRGLQRLRRAGSAVSIVCDDSLHRSMLESSSIEITTSYLRDIAGPASMRKRSYVRIDRCRLP
jgi:anti-anti-sigma factor